MWATRLSPRPDFQAGRLEKQWFESNVGWWLDLDQIIAYRKSLHEIFGEGFDCKRSFVHFEEAIYPIDCSKELLERICTDMLPDSFDAFFDDELTPLVPFRDFERAELYVLGANSD